MSSKQRQDVMQTSSDIDVAISVSNLGKSYQIYERPEDRLKQLVMPRLQRLIGLQPKNYHREHWALKGVTFKVKKGETIGIIGRNGAGKSTLLQTICGTLTPSSGEIDINGRVAALLELGSGFNPEFTGRENVYMNASILGLNKTEIDGKYRDIAAFADIGEFIEQPVKTYSSGMLVRLAFAVIAHVDADILVIDEALAVGDAIFTQKCMRFIRKFRQNGTLLFVSHDMSSVLNLCQHAVWLHHAEVREIGPAQSIAENYLQYALQEVYGEDTKLENTSESNTKDKKEVTQPSLEHSHLTGGEILVEDNLNEANGWKTGAGEIVSVVLKLANGEDTNVLKGGEQVRMTIQAVVHQPLERPIRGFLVRDRLGQDLFGENTLAYTDLNPCRFESGDTMVGEFEFTVPMLPNGQYVVMASLADGTLIDNIQHHWLHDALVLNVSSSKVRWGLVGVPFSKVFLRQLNGSD